MNSEISDVYQSLCEKNNIPVNEIIISCLNDANANGELDFTCKSLSDTDCSLVAETLKRVRTIRTLNLADCLLPFDCLKYFLDVVNELENLSLLNLKGNQIGNSITLYLSKIILMNHSITELRLGWNKMGNSINTLAEFCNSLLSNTVLITLDLSNNNLCPESSFHLAKILNTNKCLKNIDLSWNCLNEEGAVLLLKSLKNNNTLEVLNVQGNCVSDETADMISAQLKRNKSNEKNIQNKNTGLIDHATSESKNYQTQSTSNNSQYKNHIIELQLKLHNLQNENEQKKQEIDEMKKNSTKEKESNMKIQNQVEKMKSELSFQKKSVNSLIKKISKEVPNSDEKVLESLEDFEKVIYIIKQIKKRCIGKIQKETSANKLLLEEVLPKLTSKVKSLKLELRNLKTSTNIEIRKYIDELTTTKELFRNNMFHLKMSNTINNEMNKKHLIEQQKETNTLDEKATMLLLLNEKLKKLQEDNSDLLEEKNEIQLKLLEFENKATIDAQNVQALEKSLKIAKSELDKFNENQLSNIAVNNLKAQLSNDAFAREIDILTFQLNEKQKEFEYCETEKKQMEVNYNSEISKLEQLLQLEKLKFIEKRKENKKRIDELHSAITQCIDRLRKENSDDSGHEMSVRYTESEKHNI